MCHDAITPPVLTCLQSGTNQPAAPVIDPNDVFDAKDWIMANIELNDPVELRRNDLRNEAEAIGFADIDVRNLGDLNGWEMRFNRGDNRHCATPAEAESMLNQIAYFCGLHVDPARFVALVDGDRIAVRFWLQPGPEPNPA